MRCIGIGPIAPEALTPQTTTEADWHALSALCLRSKAHWGYDADFLRACRAPLTLTARDLTTGKVVVTRARDSGSFTGVAKLVVAAPEAELDKLFIDPAAMGIGLGRMLMDWAMTTARTAGARRIWITADPQAAPFYHRFGAQDAGHVPSEAVLGRMLPRLCLPI
ncbi:MAG: GNAT family N-acetyltransferase [Paracoccaceae bacterium]